MGMDWLAEPHQLGTSLSSWSIVVCRRVSRWLSIKALDCNRLHQHMDSRPAPAAGGAIVPKRAPRTGALMLFFERGPRCIVRTRLQFMKLQIRTHSAYKRSRCKQLPIHNAEFELVYFKHGVQRFRAHLSICRVQGARAVSVEGVHSQAGSLASTLSGGTIVDN